MSQPTFPAIDFVSRLTDGGKTAFREARGNLETTNALCGQDEGVWLVVGARPTANREIHAHYADPGFWSQVSPMAGMQYQRLDLLSVPIP